MDVLIHRLVWEVSAENDREAVELQKVFSQLTADNRFLAQLEEALKAVIPSQNHVLLEQVTVDIDPVSQTDNRKELVESIVRAIHDQVDEALNQAEISKRIETKPVRKSILESVYRFLEIGTIPQESPADVRTAEQFAAYSLQEIKRPEAFQRDVKALLNGDRELLNRASAIALPVVAKWLPLAASETELVFSIETALKGWQNVSELDKRTIRKLVLSALCAENKTEEMMIQVRHAIERLAEKYEDQTKLNLLNTAIKVAPRGRKPTLPEIKPYEPAQKAVDGKQTERLFVRNAGLVLAAPFLPEFFKTLKLDPRNQSDLPRLLFVLAFLDIGLADEDSADRTLYRVLLGQSPNASLFPESIVLTRKIQRETNQLLKDLIEHWKALKNTTPQGLRANFFWRTGYLGETAEGWHLLVEGKPFDILLSHLPWSIGVIKLPWMEKPLTVEWA